MSRTVLSMSVCKKLVSFGFLMDSEWIPFGIPLVSHKFLLDSYWIPIGFFMISLGSLWSPIIGFLLDSYYIPVGTLLDSY